MTASISRPVPVSFFLQHLTEFGDETQCIVAVICCPFRSWKLNAPLASTWSDTTTGWCYQQHIHSTGFRLQHTLLENAWFCVSPTFWCRCNWKQRYVIETPELCLSRRGHSLVTVHYIYIYIERGSKFLLFVIVCLYDEVRVHKQTHIHTLVNTSLAFLYVQPLAVTCNNTTRENLAAI